MKMNSNTLAGLKVVTFCYVAQTVIQILVYFLTGSLVLLAQLLDRISDISISASLLAVTSWSAKPADEFHRFGHHRAQNVAALVISVVFVSFVSVEIIRRSIPLLLLTSAAENINLPLAGSMNVVSILILAIPFLYIRRQKSEKKAIQASVTEITIDLFSYVITILTLSLISLGYFIADPVGSLVIASFIIISGANLFLNNVGYLIGKAPPKIKLEEMQKTAKSVEGVLRVEKVRAEYVGPEEIHASLHVVVERNTSLEKADHIAQKVRNSLKQIGCIYCEVQVDPSSQKADKKTG
jgi:cation diffusion facilitator family transporter